MRGFTGTKANTANGFVTLMNLTSLSAEVKAWSEAFPVIVLLIGPLPFWTLSSNKFSHRYFPCKYTFKKPNLSKGVWRKIPHLSQAVCFHQECRNLVLLETSIFLSNSTEIHQQAEKLVAHALQCTWQSCTELTPRAIRLTIQIWYLPLLLKLPTWQL